MGRQHPRILLYLRAGATFARQARLSEVKRRENGGPSSHSQEKRTRPFFPAGERAGAVKVSRQARPRNFDTDQGFDPAEPVLAHPGHPACRLQYCSRLFQPQLQLGECEMKVIAQGMLVLATMGVASTAMAADGKAVYEATCAMCHAAGVAGAPKLGDKAAWAPRLATGKAAMVASVVKGKNAMPPKGGNAALKDDEIAAAVDYITSQAK
jgi:cytochrome c5